jgi:death-on-curing protein
VRYVTASDVIKAHYAETGQDSPINFGFLELAVQLPQTSLEEQDLYPDLHTKAAALLYSLVRKRVFPTGNKRTAALSATLLYAMNDMWLEAEPDELVGLLLDVEVGILEISEIAARLKDWAIPLDADRN